MKENNQGKEKKLALVLSGGGSRGGFEIGVWQAMRELCMKIDIVTGTSVGAVNAAMVCLGEFEKAFAVWKELETNMVFDLDNESRYDEAKEEIIKNTRGFMGMPIAEALSYAKNTVTKGGASSGGMQDIISKNIDIRAFYESPVEYGLVASELPSFKGHFLFKEQIPKDKLSEYIVASASCFPAAHYTVIDGIKLVDGGYSDNLPIDMAMSRKATDMVAVDLQAVGVVKKDSIERAKNELDSFSYITTKWDLGNFLCFDPETNRRNIRLGYLDAMKAFGKLDGGWYTFTKGSIPTKNIRRADMAALVFDLDPLTEYTKESLNNKLTAAIRNIKEKNAGKNIFSGSILSGTAAARAASTLKNALSSKELTLLIAYDFIEKEGRSIFLGKRFMSRFRKEILAASYIKGEGLISYDVQDHKKTPGRQE